MERAPNVWDKFYHTQPAPWRGERNAEQLFPWLGKGPVLELGVGNGKTAKPIRRAGFDVVGIDISWNVLQAGDDHSWGTLGDVRNLPFLDNTFSAVLDLHCTGHLPPDEQQHALGEITRVLKTRGHIIQHRLGDDDLRAKKGETTEDGFGKRLSDGRTTWFLPESMLVANLVSAGFEVISKMVHERHPNHRGVPVKRQEFHVVAKT